MKKSIYLNILLFFASLIILSSCATKKKFIYFQKDENQPDTISVLKAYVPTIQPGDILSIPVTSLSAAASSFFNPFAPGAGTAPTDNTANPTGGSIQGSSIPSASGFLVDPSGNIEMPIIGSVKVAGLTTTAAKDTIKNKLRFYLKEPTVNVRFLNYKISVMGEVARPSIYVIPNEQVTLPEAISMAGDLTVYAKYDNVLIVRDNNGKKEFGRVNLNSREVFTSPYYYLHSGDLVYVEQASVKALQNDPTIKLLPLILTTIAAVALLFYRLK